MFIPFAAAVFLIDSGVAAVLAGTWPSGAPTTSPADLSYPFSQTVPSLLPVVDRCTNPKDWSLTFDDGPTPLTAAVLDALKAKQATATFFVTGANVIQNPDFVKRAYSEGHQIASHTWSHSGLTGLSDEAILAEVKWTMKAIKEVIGVTPRYMRPPEGKWDPRVQTLLSSIGVYITMWTEDRDTNDWQITANPAHADVMMANMALWVKEIRAYGPMSLQHDISDLPVGYADDIINMVVDNGFRTVTVAQCAGGQAYFEAPGSTATQTTQAASTPTTTIAVGNVFQPTPSATKKPSPTQGGSLRNSSASKAPLAILFTLFVSFTPMFM